MSRFFRRKKNSKDFPPIPSEIERPGLQTSSQGSRHRYEAEDAFRTARRYLSQDIGTDEGKDYHFDDLSDHPTLDSKPDKSLYPWSRRDLVCPAGLSSPFPRYGAAINPVASKDGTIYIMGGLVNNSTVKGDLWKIDAAALTCDPVATTHEGPGPRVGHACLVVGNAFIIHGGDTKIDESDALDETLYLLNTSTLRWSRALPGGPRPCGRYGHTLNLIGSKLYLFGGQVEGYFMRDLTAFDLNELASPDNKWEVLQEAESSMYQGPPARTNHTVVTFEDKLYLFGGTDGVTWFNDVWSYDPTTNAWKELDCIGFIPVAREGHSAVMVDDVMYGFGGRAQDGSDLGDLFAFRIASRRWYTFQNMGPSPTPRSGLGMTTVGKQILVVGGEPSSAITDSSELCLMHVLDTKKIRYPAEPPPPPIDPGAEEDAISGDNPPRIESPDTATPGFTPPATSPVAHPPYTASSDADATSDEDVSTPNPMETYYGYVRTYEDAITLFESCRLGLLPRVSRLLTERERRMIRRGSVFVWDEHEAGMKDLNDDKIFSTNEASSRLRILREVVPMKEFSARTEQVDFGRTLNSYYDDKANSVDGMDGYRYSPTGLRKLCFTITTSLGQHLHLVSYFTPLQSGQAEFKEPSKDPALRNISPPQGMYPPPYGAEVDFTPDLNRKVEQPSTMSSSSSSDSYRSSRERSLFSGPALDSLSATETAPTSYMDSISAAVSRPGDKLLSQERETLVSGNIPEDHVSDDAASDDGQSQFSMGSRGLPPSIDQDVRKIIEQLVTDSPALHNNLGPNSDEKLWQALPELLKAFAVKIGYGDQPTHIREIMFFVRQYRNSLAARLRGHVADLDLQSQLASSLDEDSDSSSSEEFKFRVPEPGMTVTEKMEQLWSDSTKFEPVEDEEVEDTTNVPDVAESTSLNAHDIKNSVAYTWLLGALSAEASSMVVGDDARSQIHESILNFLWSQERKRGPRKFRPRARAPEHHVRLVLDWDPVAFLVWQGWDGTKDASTTLATTFTLTGSSTDCQALTTEGYLAQTWPSTGMTMMEFIGRVMSAKLDGQTSGKVTLPDQAILEGSFVRGQMVVDVKGSAPSVSEAAEQLAWLGCALQASPQAPTLSYCTYHLRRKVTEKETLDTESGTPDCSFEMTFKQQPLPSEQGENQCWHSMFRNPTIARGFPIKRRVMKSAGLEMPLGMMAQLVRATRIITFNAVWYLKGFSSFLALTECRGDELLWHHVYKKDGSYASFSDLQDGLPSELSASQLQRSRHIIGWCQKADLRAGAIPDNEFDGSPSKLRRPHATCILKEATLTAGYNVNAQATADIGVRAQPLHLPKGGDYWVKINKVRQHYFLLWDEASKRGWLINGASAMLHLLLARIQYDISQGRKLAPPVADSDDPLARFRQWKSLLRLPADPYSSAAARHVLENEANKSLPIFIAGDDFRRETPSFITLFDEVNDMFSILEQVFEHESMVRHRNGVDVKPMFRPRKHLEGWDFVDIAERRPDPVYPRLKELPQMGKCWVDFTRGINASTLFARGFGELIEPSPGFEVCNTLTRLPSHQNFLGVCASDMKDILRMYSIEDDDDSTNGPTEVLEGLFWIQSPDPFKHCVGKGHTGKECCDATQVLAPKQTISKLWKWGNSSKYTAPQEPIDLDGKGAMGALFFGFTRNRPIYYLDEGEPSLVAPEVAPSEHNTAKHDANQSGLAPLASSTSGMSTSVSIGASTNATSKLYTDDTSRTDESVQGSEKQQISAGEGIKGDDGRTGLLPAVMSKKKSGLMGRFASKLKLGREGK